MYTFFVKIFLNLFCPKKYRAKIKYKMLGFWTCIAVRHRAKSCGENLNCGDNKVRVNRNTTIGNNCWLGGIDILGVGEVEFGDYVHTGKNITIISDNHNYEGETIPYDETVIKKTTRISSFVWLGANVTILPGTSIGEGAIIQAGAVVHGEIPPYAIAGGNPAKVFKYRDIEHFKELKEQQKFY